MGLGLLVDEQELRKFVEWLPDIQWNEAYTVMILIRSKLLKKKYGFKGTDHTLKLEIVPGYLVRWRERLVKKIKQFALLGYHSEELYEYVRYKPGTREPEEIINIPHQLIGIMIGINPADWVKVSVKAVEEFNMSLLQAMYNPEQADKLVRRIDLRIPALCMKYAKRRFHMIDLDTKNSKVVSDFESRLKEVLGYRPAKIETPHGYHYIIPVYKFDKETAIKWFGKITRVKDTKPYEFISKPGFLDQLPLLKQYYAYDLGILGDDEAVDKLIEYKSDFQEPAPGTLYQGDFIVRFYREQ